MPTSNEQQHLRPILAADDEVDDRFLLRRAIEKSGIANPLIAVTDGKEVVNYLGGVAPFNDRVKFPLPAILFLDLKMPVMTGFDVLRWLQSREEFKQMPVVVLTSSSDGSDREKAMALGATDYRVKPTNNLELARIVQEICERWLEPSS